jgi:hypothetical protein
MGGLMSIETGPDNDNPGVINHPLYELLHDEKIEEFNEYRAAGHFFTDFRGGHFRGLDLRGLNAAGLDFQDAYFRGSDIRGVDFRQTKLQGASIADTKISGVYFPPELSVEEILLSLEHGTRMRYRTVA